MTGNEVINATAAVLNLTLASFVLRQKRQGKGNQIFLTIATFVAVWNLSAIWVNHATSLGEQQGWANVLTLAVIYLPALCIHLTSELLNWKRKWWIIAVYVANSSMILSGLTGQLIVIKNQHLTGGMDMHVYLPLYMLEGIILVGMTYIHGHRSKQMAERALSIANCVIVIGGVHDLLPLLGQGWNTTGNGIVNPTGGIASMLYALLAGYSIAYHYSQKTYIQLSKTAAQASRALWLFGSGIALLAIAEYIAPEQFKAGGTLITVAIMAATCLTAPLLTPNLFRSLEDRLERKLLGDKLERHGQMLTAAEGLSRNKRTNQTIAELATHIQTYGRAHAIWIAAKNGEQVQEYYSQGEIAAPSKKDINEIAAIFQKHNELVITSRVLSNENPELGKKATEQGWHTLMRIPQKAGDTEFILIQTDENKPTAQDLLCEAEVIKEAARAIEITTARETTQKAQHDELLQRMAVGFVKDLHYMINEPLHTLERLRKGHPAAHLYEEAGRAITALQNVKAYVKAATFFGVKQKPHLGLVQIEELLKQCQREWEGKASNKGAVINIECANKLETDGDHTLLKRAIGTAIQNAVEGGIPGQTNKITLKGTENGKRVNIAIIDQGYGIPEHLKDQIWEPYFSTKHKAPQKTGAGLGLPTLKRIVEEHGGTAQIESEWKKGTTVNIRLNKSQRTISGLE